MTLVQLEYIVAVDTYRSFVGAAEKCFVTQPTLSMQVQKLEEELDKQDNIISNDIKILKEQFQNHEVKKNYSNIFNIYFYFEGIYD